MRRISLSAFIFIFAFLVFTPFHNKALAASGDLVHETSFSNSCSSGIGVGIAFDGKYLWYSCYNSTTDLYKSDPLTGAVVSSYNVAGGLGALAWDGKRKMLWAGWGHGSGSDGDVRLIDPATGVGTIKFNASSDNYIDLDDGLAYDAQDDTLYISPDTSTQVHHYSLTGTLLSSFPWAGSGCYNSGVAIGGKIILEGSDGCNHVWAIDKTTHAPLFDFATGADGVRDEDLECDNVTFSPKTVMWSMEAYEPRRAIAFEIPAGSCDTGGGVDSDGDGLLDDWEKNGVWIQPNGTGTAQFIDLPAMGADPNKPDIFLQTDWMQNGTHNQQLQAAAIKKIVDAFAASPYHSPTGSNGINLHVDNGSSSIMNYATNATWGTLSKAQSIPWVSNLGTNTGGSYDWTAFQTIKDANFTPTGRTPIFHYVIVANNYDSTTSSGISRGIGASDLIVSLGSFTGGTGSVNEQAGTLMHELGHNLGLHHGGDVDTNYKPNYLSIMSYGFQLNGLTIGGTNGHFDYSSSTLGSLDETNLTETSGVSGAPAGYGTSYFCPGGAFTSVANAAGAIDWNCNGVSTNTGVSTDINNDTAKTTLTGYNDWANLKLKGGAIGLAGAAPTLPTLTEPDLLTIDIARQLETLNVTIDIKPGSNPAPVNPNSNGQMPVVILSTDTFDATTIDPNSVKFGATGTEASPVHSSLTDVNGDGKTDMLLQFDIKKTVITCDMTSASLKGKTTEGQQIAGTEPIVTVGCK